MPTKPETTTGSTTGADLIIDIRDLAVHYGLSGGTLARLFGSDTGTVKAVDGINLALQRGEVVGLVGESGSGKSTLGRALLGLVQATAGSITFEGQDLAQLSRRRLRALRRDIQMVFQDPNAALNPSMTVEEAVGDALRVHGMRSASERRVEGHRRARAGRAVPGRAVPREVPARPVGRPEAARGHGAGDHHRPQRAGGRRADLDARHVRARQDPAADARPQGGPRAHLRLHHPRPRQREVLLRPDRDHVPRPDRRDRLDRGDLRQPPPPLHEGAAAGHPRPGPGPPADPRPAAR